MTNDTTTLNGSLLEMKDQLIYELGQKGVTATFDPSTGLLGLIARIGDIDRNSYHIEFNSSSYEASGGSATISCTLQENYAVKSGATVTFTGSDSSVYTGITNQNGVATCTVSVSANTTFTCSYGNVSDTCTVTVPAPSYSLAFSQSTYYADFGDVAVSCTLTSGGTPVSGATITFSYQDLLGPETTTATTNANGVANAGIYSDVFGEFTVTATYENASATCTVINEL